MSRPAEPRNGPAPGAGGKLPQARGRVAILAVDRPGARPRRMPLLAPPITSEAELVARYDGRAPRYTSYPTAPHFTPAIGPSVYARWLGELPEDAALSIYLHVPFCERLCLYCACNTSVVRLESSLRAYGRALTREIDCVAGLIGGRPVVSHVHWGGGTATSLPADSLVEIMGRLRERFAVAADVEVAIEIDPTALPSDRLQAIARMGVTRVSLGVQDFEPAVQRAIGREQSYDETRDCVLAARALGVRSLNLDLMYGLPLQTSDSVARTARRALELEADRMAVFGYAHVPWMKRHQALIPESALPGSVERYAQVRTVHRVLTAEGGYVPVGLDHYAAPGDALAKAAASGRLKRGFQGYTTDVAPILVGLGASAVGSLPQGYVQNASSAAAFMNEIGSGRLATARGVELGADDRLRREAIECVMCDLAVDFDKLAAAHDADPVPLKKAAEIGLPRFVADGLADWDGRRLVVNERGRPFLRSIAALFDRHLAEDAVRPRHSRAV